jgi:hypothetical protein
MDRIPNSYYAEGISYARSLIPPKINDLIGNVDFFCGTDPIFAGLHSYENIGDGRSYRDTAHCLYPNHIDGPRSRKNITIAIPEKKISTYVYLHEMGHVLDYRTNFDHNAFPLTKYANNSSQEAFAEAFAHWFYKDLKENSWEAGRDSFEFFKQLSSI